MIKNERVNLITNNNRENAIKEALKTKFDTIILDDGLQDLKYPLIVKSFVLTKNKK